jgi:hypothetical protein
LIRTRASGMRNIKNFQGFFLVTIVEIACHLFKKEIYLYTGLSKKMDGIWNRYNLKSTGRIYTFGILKCSEKFKVLDLP